VPEAGEGQLGEFRVGNTKLIKVNPGKVFYLEYLFSNHVDILQFHTHVLGIGHDTPTDIWLRNIKPGNTFLALGQRQRFEEVSEHLRIMAKRTGYIPIVLVSAGMDSILAVMDGRLEEALK